MILISFFTKGNDRDLVIRVRASNTPSNEIFDKETVITLSRSRGTAKLQVEGLVVPSVSLTQVNNRTVYRLSNGGIFDPAPVMNLFKHLSCNHRCGSVQKY